MAFLAIIKALRKNINKISKAKKFSVLILKKTRKTWLATSKSTTSIKRFLLPVTGY